MASLLEVAPKTPPVVTEATGSAASGRVDTGAAGECTGERSVSADGLRQPQVESNFA